MEKQYKKLSGISLLLGSVLMTLTMVLHPVGGSPGHLLRLYNMIIVSHSLALLCLPFIAFGFYGLAKSLFTPSRISYLAFTIIIFGLFASMIAATINGLTLPLFLSANADKLDTEASSVQMILSYGFSINKPMSYIMIIASTLAIAIWSLVIIKTANFPKWFGYFGIALVGTILLSLLLKANLIHLFLFRMYLLGLIAWIVLAALLLMNYSPKKNNQS